MSAKCYLPDGVGCFGDTSLSLERKMFYPALC